MYNAAVSLFIRDSKGYGGWELISEERQTAIRKQTMLDAGELTPDNLDYIELWKAEISLATRFAIGQIDKMPGLPESEEHAAIRRKAMMEVAVHAPVDGEEAIYWLNELMLRVAVIQHGPVSATSVALLGLEQQMKARRMLREIEEGPKATPMLHLVKAS